MKLLLLPIVATAIVAAAHRPDCPPHFELGQTYHEIQSTVCPDIDSVAAFRADDSVHVAYFCPSKQTMVVGDRRTGKVDAFFLYRTAK